MRPREHYLQELDVIQGELCTLGDLAAGAIIRAVNALAKQDLAAAQSIVADDHRINRAQHALEDRTVAVIATQQPVARDLRQLVAVITIANELERIADYAKGIAKLTLRERAQPPVPAPEGLAQVAVEACAMLDSALEAFISQDIAAAEQLAEADNLVDALYRRVVVELLDLLRQQPAAADQITDLLFVAHSLERMADRATNIAERVIYMASGDMVELNP